MKPTIQASNINLCDVSSNSFHIKWQNGTGDRRIVVISPEKAVDITAGTSSPSPSPAPTFGDTGLCSTYLNPDPFEVRHNFPGYYPYYKKDSGIGSGCNCCSDESTSCNNNIVYESPNDAFPVDGIIYSPNKVYGSGDQIMESNLGTTYSSCPSPSPSPSPSLSIIAEPTDVSNGSYVVYEGTGSEVTVLGLKPSTGYYVNIYEYTSLCKEYLLERTNFQVVTSKKVETARLVFNVTNCRTNRPEIKMVYIFENGKGKKSFECVSEVLDTDICKFIKSEGSTDNCGKYKSLELETGKSYTVKIGNNLESIDYILNNVYLKKKGELTKSELHPNWTQGTRVIPYYQTRDEDKYDRVYDIKI